MFISGSLSFNGRLADGACHSTCNSQVTGYLNDHRRQSNRRGRDRRGYRGQHKTNIPQRSEKPWCGLLCPFDDFVHVSRL